MLNAYRTTSINLLCCAETEKYAHVTFFFNGGREKPFDLEDRLMVPSPKVATYDLQPEMSADGVGKAVSQCEGERERERERERD